MDQHTAPRARSSHHPTRKITGTFPSTALLGYGCMNCGEISGVRSDVYMHVQLPTASNYYRASQTCIEQVTSHTDHDSHIVIYFSSSFRSMFWVLLCPLLLKWNKFKAAKDNIKLSERFGHLNRRKILFIWITTILVFWNVFGLVRHSKMGGRWLHMCAN